MQQEFQSPPLSYSDSDVAAVLADLQSEVSGTTSLQTWQQSTGVPVERVVSGSDITYVHLGAFDHSGSQVVLMLRDGIWHRAM
ncbi:hypothetical protein [Agrococcus sp. Ld7]|uniref:hypothetical protein n=1 Tax=Agrococcus sp. Ld7 TaxID=649148 RepID=UPI00386FE5AD